VKVDKMSISLAPDLGAAVREEAKSEGIPLSAWVADALAEKLRAKAFDKFIAEWEAKHGVITEEEMAEAARELGLPWSNTEGEAGS
jgi:post-segregation antitoxin (ccd killing protein)